VLMHSITACFKGWPPRRLSMAVANTAPLHGSTNTAAIWEEPVRAKVSAVLMWPSATTWLGGGALASVKGWKVTAQNAEQNSKSARVRGARMATCFWHWKINWTVQIWTWTGEGVNWNFSSSWHWCRRSRVGESPMRAYKEWLRSQPGSSDFLWIRFKWENWITIC
jgi:hypothetical protein